MLPGLATLESYALADTCPTPADDNPVTRGASCRCPLCTLSPF